jgi:prepilin-type N-terminal cleavage/methylation domain-containing protein
MPKMTALSMVPRKNRVASFTLIELLAVMAIIAILAGLTLAAANGVWTKAARSRAASEIQAMSAALESYKIDNGIYPYTNAATSSGMSTTLLTNSVATPYLSTTLDGTGTEYQKNSQVLYQALSGQTNFNDTPAAGAKVYMAFKRNQVGDAAGGSYVKDPWGYSYGYSIGSIVGATTNAPYNGSGFFDLWSTGGLLTAKANTNAWISNWQ